MRRQFLITAVLVIVLEIVIGLLYPPFLWSLVIVAPLLLIGFIDFFQTKHAVLRNFPILGHARYFFEKIRPEIYQYFIESDTDGRPFGRDERSLVYQRAKNVRDTVAFGTLENIYTTGYEWINHSLAPRKVESKDMRITVGGPDCTQPYSCSIFNISAMSYGSLSANAVLALSGGAKMGSFAHNTGEGGVSPYHFDGGGDLIWQLGTGYFGCRTDDGRFNPESFAETAKHPQIKMIELKLSQGAKPGKGGILPAAKVTPEIAKIRHVPVGEDVISPAYHKEFDTPIGLLEFIGRLRELSGGKPVGFKLCIGKRREFLAICKAMIETNIMPDFIAIDGAEGGTGAAPLEFSNHVGTPLIEGLIFAHNALVGFGLRDQIKIFASGKVSSAFEMVKRLALGADACYAARPMMMALGCIQALKCNSNHCPVGVATQDPNLMAGLVPSDKKVRVASYHKQTIKAMTDMLGAAGLERPEDLRPWHIMRRTGPTEIAHYAEIYHYLEEGVLREEPYPSDYARALQAATAGSFAHAYDQ